jgi:uncharacterized BrkB/YihY/UPF0761 family membrane protein
MVQTLLIALVGFAAGAVFMFYWYPYTLARHPEKIAALQHRSEQLAQDAGDIIARTLQTMRDAANKP